MATLEQRNNGYRLRFQIGSQRHSVTLKDFDQAAADVAKAHIEHLITQHRRNRPPFENTLDWLDKLPDEVHDRLASIKLTESRKRSKFPRSVIAFMNAYIETRTDWKKPENYKQSVGHLKAYLKRDAPIGSLTDGDAEKWQQWMMHDKHGPKLSPNTAGQHVKRCRQMMKQAIKFGLTRDNPFADIKINLESDSDKDYEVTPAEALAILEACPDQEWRTIFALTRFGGLRCPSEVLALRWSDIAWDRGRFKVRSSKTARYGKGERIVPLWEELRAELEAQRELCESRPADKVGRYVVQRYRDTEANLRTTFHKICDRAGVVRFPKPFMNCRTTRRNELDKQGVRNAALNAWFGHSKQTAEKHYDRVTDDEFVQAVTASGEIWGQDWGNA